MAGLRARGFDTVTVADLGLCAHSDVEVLRAAHTSGRVVVTHDTDFGTLVIRDGLPFTGIIHLRPGHHLPSVTLVSVDTLASLSPKVEPPFVVVVVRSGDQVHVRARSIKV